MPLANHKQVVGTSCTKGTTWPNNWLVWKKTAPAETALIAATIDGGACIAKAWQLRETILLPAL